MSGMISGAPSLRESGKETVGLANGAAHRLPPGPCEREGLELAQEHCPH